MYVYEVCSKPRLRNSEGGYSHFQIVKKFRFWRTSKRPHPGSQTEANQGVSGRHPGRSFRFWSFQALPSLLQVICFSQRGMQAYPEAKRKVSGSHIWSKSAICGHGVYVASYLDVLLTILPQHLPGMFHEISQKQRFPEGIWKRRTAFPEGIPEAYLL